MATLIDIFPTSLTRVALVVATLAAMLLFCKPPTSLPKARNRMWGAKPFFVSVLCLVAAGLGIARGVVQW